MFCEFNKDQNSIILYDINPTGDGLNKPWRPPERKLSYLSIPKGKASSSEKHLKDQT